MGAPASCRCPLSQDHVKLTQTNASPPPVIFGEIIGRPAKSLSRTTDLAPQALRLFASPKHREFRKITACKFRIAAAIPMPLSWFPLVLTQAVASLGRVNRPRYFFIGHCEHTPGAPLYTAELLAKLWMLLTGRKFPARRNLLPFATRPNTGGPATEPASGLRRPSILAGIFVIGMMSTPTTSGCTHHPPPASQPTHVTSWHTRHFSVGQKKQTLWTY